MAAGRHAGARWDESLRRRLADAAAEAAAVLLPVSCAGCGAPDRAVCEACRAALAPEPIRREIAGVPVVSAGAYAGVAKRILLSLKRDGRTDVAPALVPLAARAVAEALAAGPPRRDVELLVIPATRRGARSRGFHPVELLLRRAGLRPSRVLRWEREPEDQIGLGRASRRANLRDALVARHVGGRAFILVDDVVTTGATLSAAVSAVTAAGGETLSCACLLSTPMRLPPVSGDSPGTGGRRT